MIKMLSSVLLTVADIFFHPGILLQIRNTSKETNREMRPNQRSPNQHMNIKSASSSPITIYGFHLSRKKGNKSKNKIVYKRIPAYICYDSLPESVPKHPKRQNTISETDIST